MPLGDSKPKTEYSRDNAITRARELDREIARTDETRQNHDLYARATYEGARIPSNFIPMCSGREIRSLYRAAAS